MVNAPKSFDPVLSGLEDVTIHKDHGYMEDINFLLIFVMTQNEIINRVEELLAKIKGDAILWFAYPKGTSKKYTSDISRDDGWNALGASGFECVRQIVIDEDWSALRFRRVEFIKSIARDPKRALSLKGRARALNK